MKLKIMTYNIASGHNYQNMKMIDVGLAAEAVRPFSPDILALNEVHGEGGEFTEQTEELREKLGYPYSFFCPAIEINGGPYGNAFLSKYPILSAEKFMVEDPAVKDEDTYYETRCVLKVKVDVGGGLDVLVTHFGLARKERENAVKKVLEILPEGPFVFMGDLNSHPDDPILKPIYEVMHDTAESYPEKELWSYPSDAPVGKIDYIFTSRDIRTLKTATVDAVTSDHKPLTAEVEVF